MRFVGGKAYVDGGGAPTVGVERLLLPGRAPAAHPAAPAVAEMTALLFGHHRAFQHIVEERHGRGQFRVADAPRGQDGEQLVPDAVNGLEFHPSVIEHHFIKGKAVFQDIQHHG